MAMVVAHNIPALSTYNVINSTSSALQKSINKLSTGLRINSAADDAAGLAISEKMRAQVRGLDQAVANSQDGISMIQTAEGALSETHSILQRMRELSVQAANDTLTQQDRGYIQEEVDQLREEITRIGNTTQFNKKKLLNGDAAVLWSSSDSGTKAIVNGGLRTIDQFGQKSSAEGNYKIKIKAEAGQGEVQKTDIFKIKHPDVVMNKNVNATVGVTDVEVENVPAGGYALKAAEATGDVEATLTGVYGIDQISTRPDNESAMAATIAAGHPSGFVIKDSNGNVLLDSASLADDSTNNFTGGEFGAGATAANQGAVIAANKATIQAKAKELGYSVDVSDSSGTITWNVTQAGGGTAPSISVEYKDEDAGTITNTPGTATNTTPALTDIFTVDKGSTLTDNASVLFEVTNVDATNGTITLNATANILKADGSTETKTKEGIVVGTNEVALDNIGLTGVKIKETSTNYIQAMSEGSKFVYNFKGMSADTDTDRGVVISTTQDTTWPEGWNGAPQRADTTYNLTIADVAGSDIEFNQFYLNEKNGEVIEGGITISTDKSKFTYDNLTAGTVLTSFDAAYIGKVAGGDVKLRDLDKFWDTEGNFMLTDPQTITLTQGDGKQASVTLYANDTLNDVAEKFNNAIATGLGQGQYVNNADNFVTYVDHSGGTESESVKGTFLIRSVVPGSNGDISFSGSESVINAFSLNTIQKSTETSYTANITDAHSGKTIASNVQVTGNKLIGVINENVDVEFDAMAGITAKWDADHSKYTYESKDYETTLHLSDNTTVFQIGANEGEDMGINIGDMRSHALGLDNVNVTNRESAARSITVIDGAIDKVSMQRSKLGAYQNRLEHTINNLNTASENLTSAESRIRDTDMAKEMMNFSKLQIMLQAGNSMLAQANQLPQNVLSLVR